MIIYFLISVILNLLLFIPAFHYKTDKLTDISYSITFIILITIGLFSGGTSIPEVILFIMIFIWAVRLGSFLFIRINRFGRDKRFDDKRDNFIKFLGFWLLQGVSVFIILIPSLLVFSSKVDSFNIYSIFGIIIFLSGLFIESIADFQKFNFITNSKNKGKWIDKGLWSYSRHPNYLGEIMVWSGIYFFAIFYLNLNHILISIISPAFISFLLLFVSGIPILEKSAMKKWGKDKEYRKYLKKTGKLFPKL